MVMAAARAATGLKEEEGFDRGLGRHNRLQACARE